MSRGGFKGKKRLPGAEFSWETEGGGEVDNGPTPLFPKYLVPSARPLSQTEREQADHYRRLREKIHDGPYFAMLGAPPSWGKEGVSARAQFDPFQGMATYGQRYVKKTRALPVLSSRSYVMNFFPKQLWSTLDPKYVGLPDGSTSGVAPLTTRKRGFEDIEDEQLDEERKKRNVLGDEEEGSEPDEETLEGEEDEEGEDDIVDDDFEEDEEDMGGDYNAEQYFDAGDDDGDGYDAGGGGDDFDTY
ncbi:hypothetical protein VTO42DRAFT_7512 [Malbranchea cinnamomea]